MGGRIAGSRCVNRPPYRGPQGRAGDAAQCAETSASFIPTDTSRDSPLTKRLAGLKHVVTDRQRERERQRETERERERERESVYLGPPSSVDVDADGAVGSAAAHEQMSPVEGLQHADEVTTAVLRIHNTSELHN